ncbi:HNH endonuclease [Nonomuraea sp. NPDC049269]|uniref:HNH endonuclease n=1 Tax=Nonomuraea sp. NPDC049269 TaxID=3364349 RepID=UPI0037117B4B
MALNSTTESGYELVARLAAMDLPDEGPQVEDAQGLLRALVMFGDARGRYFANPALLSRLFAWQETPAVQVAAWRDELVAQREIDVELIGRCCYSNRPVPIVSIVNRRRFRRFAGRDHIPTAIRRAVYRRDGHQCVRCGVDADLSLDHIVPWSLGGPDTIDNLQTLCRPCNSSKGARV